MNLGRIRRDIAAAQLRFPTLESHASPDGKPFALAAIQTTQRQIYILSIGFPDLYPNEMPRVFVRRPELAGLVPHRYSEGHLCFQHHSTWNPGRHDLVHVMARVAKWLNKYEVWRTTNRWPGAEVRH